MITKLGEHYANSRLIAIDPVPLRATIKNDNIEFINDYFKGQIDGINGSAAPNLLVMDNVLEHIQDLRVFMDGILANTRPGDYVYVCVPSFDLICKNFQFQEIIHEHTQYFKLAALDGFFEEYGFRSINSFSNKDDGRGYNYHLFKMEKHGHLKSTLGHDKADFSLGDALDIYRNILGICNSAIKATKAPVWGVCASELTPTLAYFMESDLSFCDGILDTSDHKFDKWMPSVRSKIISMDSLKNIGLDDTFFITAPHLTFPAIRNLKNLNAKNFINPSFFI